LKRTRKNIVEAARASKVAEKKKADQIRKEDYFLEFKKTLTRVLNIL
jgi:hypothetical protein